MGRDLSPVRYWAVKQMFRALGAASRTSQLWPPYWLSRHGVTRRRNVVYAGRGNRALKLDIYRPQHVAGVLPAALYLHGGGYQYMSKNTHWMMAMLLAREGFVVFNVDYRLAPTHRFPAAQEDAADAYRWVCDNAGRYGADVDRLVVAGESAGGGLALSLAIQACWPLAAPWARKVYDTQVVPTAIVPFCGLLQVSDAHRTMNLTSFPLWMRERLSVIHGAFVPEDRTHLDLADPICLFESLTPGDRAFPPTYASVGLRDPILGDTQRLEKRLQQLRVKHRVDYYPGEPHAFQTLIWKKSSKDTWSQLHQFLREVMDPSESTDTGAEARTSAQTPSKQHSTP